MAIDLNRFIGTFFDEAQEHLESLEEMAMSLGSGREDPELLNSIFRAAHSIKGGSGTFGFSQLTEATHEMETLFDALRRGKGRADHATVRLVLDACDVFKAHLARLKAGDQSPDPAMSAMRERLAGNLSGSPASPPAPAGTPDQSPVPSAVPMRTVIARATDPARAAEVRRILAESLGSSGDILGDSGDPSAVRVATWRSLDDLREVLAFALPPESFALAEEGQAPAGERYGLFAAEAPAQKYGLFADEGDAPPASPAPGGEARYGLFEAPAAAAEESRGAARARADQSSIRVSVEKIDRIVNLVGELVIAQAMMQQAAGTMAEQHDEHLTRSLATLDRNTRDLQQAVMSIRMMPMEFVFSRFPRLVYDVSARLGKKVELHTQGHETELDKELIELLIDPLTHVVRNAIDHGIEPPEERRRSGKPEAGSVSMRATHRGGSVIIEVADDGRGLDRDRILAKARELGMPVDDQMGDAEVWGLIFEAGFTTAQKVTDLSGRGVGMDVVRRNIASLGGSVSVHSERGEGTTITIQLPLTLAVLEGMIVSVADEQYIIPLEFVAEAFKPGPGDIRTVVNQASLVAVRGEHLPIVRLEDLVQLPPVETPRPEPLCLVVEIDQRRAALLVDSLIGQQQLVVKSLESNLHHVGGIAGATILGDGRVSLILDVSAIARSSAVRAARSAA